MPRRGFIPKREVLPDPVYGTVVVTKLINQLMYDGKRGTAQRVCYEAFEMVAEKTGKEATEVFDLELLAHPWRAQHGRAPGCRDYRRFEQRR